VHNKSIKLKNYIGPLQDPYSEALPEPPDPGQGEKKNLQKLVKLRAGSILEVPQLWEKLVPGCWTNHRQGTVLHCRRAIEWDHQIAVERGYSRVRQLAMRATMLTQIGGRAAREGPPHLYRTRSCMRFVVGMEASAIPPTYMYMYRPTGICRIICGRSW